ncbi:MAG: hypothetical protein ACM3PS_03895, partial [Syntrophothermus sp.]
MNAASPSDEEDFQRELNALRSLLEENLKRADPDPFLGTQLQFWLESARFLEKYIEVWYFVGNLNKRDEAREKLRRVLYILLEVFIKLSNDSGE